jgi:hypothetical protein
LVDEVLFKDKNGIVGNADKDSKVSSAIASGIFDLIGGYKIKKKLPGQSAGRAFERISLQFLEGVFGEISHLHAFEHIFATENCNISNFEQYEHLDALRLLAKDNQELSVTLSNDYVIKPDIMVSKSPLKDTTINGIEDVIDGSTAKLTPVRLNNQTSSLLHASVSCKWTMRSDRAQNARSEALNLLRNRKGRAPHISVIVAEPLPSRIASLALGTGDVDCVYHFALPELCKATANYGGEEASNLLNMMIEGKRLRDIADLPFDLLS